MKILRKIIEFVELVGVNLLVQWRSLIEYGRVIASYYPNPTFRKIDRAMVGRYLFDNPFQISKQFLKERGVHDVYAYGETPLTTLDYIAHQCHFSSEDTVFELGCGRGRTCFWLNTFIGCNVVGIDYVSEFIRRADTLKEAYAVEGVSFRCEDILETDLSGATCLYLYGSNLEDEVIQKLIRRFQKLPAGTKIITVSYPLSDFSPNPDFEVMQRFSARFTWGTTDVYLQIKKT